MKNIFIYIISAIMALAILVIYADTIVSYGISLKSAIIFAVIILLCIIIGYVITRLIAKKFYEKGKNGDSK
ncbi:MAG: hypothetical protein ACI4VF_07870 [Lachnospirales bacterium]